MGRMPSAVGYQPTLADEVGALQERIASTKDGAITSLSLIHICKATSIDKRGDALWVKSKRN